MQRQKMMKNCFKKAGTMQKKQQQQQQLLTLLNFLKIYEDNVYHCYFFFHPKSSVIIVALKFKIGIGCLKKSWRGRDTRTWRRHGTGAEAGARYKRGRGKTNLFAWQWKQMNTKKQRKFDCFSHRKRNSPQIKPFQWTRNMSTKF